MSILLAGCCCASCTKANLIASQLGGNSYPGREYYFPASFLMSIRAPITPSLETCSKFQECDEGQPWPDCRKCDQFNPGLPNCYPPGVGACYPPHSQCGCQGQFTTGTTKSHLGAYVWNGGTFVDIKGYTSTICKPDLASYPLPCPDPPYPCTTPSTHNLYERNTIGNVAWDATRTNANLLASSPAVQNSVWDKWWIPPQYNPIDDCAYIFNQSTTTNTFRKQPNTTLGYKTATIYTYPGQIGVCSIPDFPNPPIQISITGFNVNVTQHFGFETKTNIGVACDVLPSGYCPGPCEDPCLAFFLRVKIEGLVNQAQGPGTPFDPGPPGPQQSTLRYPCVCSGSTCTPSPFVYVLPTGGITNSCNVIPSATGGRVWTDAFYRSYWNGTDTLQEWLQKPLKLYKISGSFSDNPCGGDFDSTFSQSQRSYLFADTYTTGDCANPTGGTVAGCCKETPPGSGNCSVETLQPVGYEPNCGCHTSNDTSRCDTIHLARTRICPAGFNCSGASLYAPNNCTSCPGGGIENDRNCKVCTYAAVCYDVCKTKPGGEFFTQADIDNMPVDWENIPLQITPVYNPQLPDIQTVKSFDICGALVSGTGTVAGGTLITITGTHFLYASSVTVNGIACTDVVWVNNTKITAKTPASLTAGSYFVRVITPGGTSVPSAGDVFIYTANNGPGVCSTTPAFGPSGGGTLITITGANFTGATAVKIGGILCTNVTVLHSGAITCVTPAAVPAGYVGNRPVQVTTPYGTSGSSTQFTYQ